MHKLSVHNICKALIRPIRILYTALKVSCDILYKLKAIFVNVVPILNFDLNKCDNSNKWRSLLNIRKLSVKIEKPRL